MSSEKIIIETDTKFIQKFFEIAECPMPEKITGRELKSALNKINNKLKPQPNQKEKNEVILKEDDVQLKVLIIDNVGFVMQRIKQQLIKDDCIVEIFDDAFRALDRVKKEYFDFVILNILIPTEREGLIFLQELKEILDNKKTNTKIIITGVSLRKELIAYLNKNGLLHVIERKIDWINKVLNIIEIEKDILE